jgi:hypothetical protein
VPVPLEALAHQQALALVVAVDGGQQEVVLVEKQLH